MFPLIVFDVDFVFFNLLLVVVVAGVSFSFFLPVGSLDFKYIYIPRKKNSL